VEIAMASERFETTYEFRSKTYIGLLNVAWHLHDVAKESTKGRLLNLRGCTVFCAFAFEAYLNHVGEEELPFWAEIDRISYKDKLSVLSKHLGFKADKGAKPFQTITTIFKLRDKLAHGRTVQHKSTHRSKRHAPRDEIWRLLPWEKLTVDQVGCFFEDVNTAIEAINSSRKSPDERVLLEEPRSYATTRVRPRKSKKSEEE
jgi:hypothetical protein